MSKRNTIEFNAGPNAPVYLIEREFDVELRREEGKVFAEVELPGFGQLSVPDMGGGEDAALEGLRMRISNILKENEPEGEEYQG